MQTVFHNVLDLLEAVPETRGNDHLLYVKYLEVVEKVRFNRNNFIKYQQSFEGISRARRKVQELYPELTAKYVQEKRMDNQEQYSKFYRW
jgi:hypothetical protein